MANARAGGGSRAAPGGYTLVVAVSNPDHVEQLLRTAVDLARWHDGTVRVVSVVHKPATSPFLLFDDDRIRREYAGDRGPLLDRAVATAETLAADSGVAVESQLLIGSDVSAAIRDAVTATDADALLLGWQEGSGPTDIVLGSTVDSLLRHAPCDVFVERVGTTADGLDSVLLPTDGGPHADLAADLAGALAGVNDAAVTVLSVAPSDATGTERASAESHVEAALERLADVEAAGRVLESDDVAASLVRAAEDHDLVALGATREGRLRDRIVGSVARGVGRYATPPIVIARRPTGGRVTALLSRVFHGRS